MIVPRRRESILLLYTVSPPPFAPVTLRIERHLTPSACGELVAPPRSLPYLWGSVYGNGEGSSTSARSAGRAGWVTNNGAGHKVDAVSPTLAG